MAHRDVAHRALLSALGGASVEADNLISAGV